MKKIIIIMFFALFSFLSFGQLNIEELRFSLGVNAVNSLGKHSPFNNPDEWAFSTPISLGIECRWMENWGFEQSFSFNTFTTSSVIDDGDVREDKSFFSTNAKVKHYLNDYLFPRRAEWLDFNINAGLGIFTIEGDLNATFNIGGDVFFWISDEFGLSLKSLAKFAFNSDETVYLSNHFQHHLQLVYRFDLN